MLRKLLLRGYTVKVISRNPEEKEFPTSVEIVRGDVGDYESVRQAVKGVDKVAACLLGLRRHCLMRGVPAC